MRTVMALAALTILVAGGARAAVTVLGSDSAEQCSKAAIDGKSDLADQHLCTLALNQDLLDAEDKAGTLVNRGVMKLRRGEWDSAKADFNAALALEPNLGEAFVNRGAMWLGEKNYPQSLEDLNRALALGVKEPEKAYFDRAIAYEGLNDEKSAYFDYMKALQLKPGWILPERELLRFHVTVVHSPS